MDTNINFKSRKLVDFFKKNKGKKLLLINTRSPLGDLCILLKNALLVKANNFHIVLFASRIPDILQDFKKHITLCGELLEKNDFRYFINSISDRSMPFINQGLNENMDLQLNIFGVRRR